MSERFSKLYIALKFRLKGMGFYEAMRALEIARDIHDGFRKDGKTPEFQHQLEIAHYILCLKDVENLEKVIIAALFHDTDEDYPFDIEPVVLASFGDDVYEAVRLLNKHRSSNLEEYFRRIAACPIASIVKGCDRVNNFQSMNRGKFTLEKQEKYAFEVANYFLPMLKRARKNFPRQMDAFYAIEHMLKSQHELVLLIIGAAK